MKEHIKISVIEDKNKSIQYSRSCIEIAPRALLMAAAVILSVLLVSIMISQFNSAQGMVNSSSEVISKRTMEIRNSEIMQYDGLTVTGEEVINFMKKNLDVYGSGEAPFSITLKGTSGHSESYSEYSALNALTDPESEKYIKPFSKWRCMVKKNKNDIITEVIFSKKQ